MCDSPSPFHYRPWPLPTTATLPSALPRRSAGEDNKSFRLTDIDSTIAGFAGADYDMQVCDGILV